MGEAISNRRALLTAGGALGVLAALSAPADLLPKAEVAGIGQAGPLTDLIRAYRAGVSAFEADPCTRSLDNELIAQRSRETWERPFHELKAAAPPARTREEAMDAILLAQEELADEGGSGIVMPLLDAALAYLDGQGGS
ncbi:hypothetical protein V5F63_08235 [Xanthobacter autotrophicus DSM 597]|uniref:hypothetical protein n=1 Tax=Xanthobacter wiegelii TaxID=3119913 RepID=UPI00372B8CA6